MKLSRPRQKFLLQQVKESLGKEKRMLTVTEFAGIVGRHYQTIWHACSSGDIVSVQRKKGAQYRIHFHQLDQFFPEEAAA